MRNLNLFPNEASIAADEGRLMENEYPGRVAIMGLGQKGDRLIQAYALMGRSTGSRNRIFMHEANGIRTIAPDKTPEEMAATPNADLIYYQAMAEDSGVNVVSNGAQTTHVLRAAVSGYPLAIAVENAPTVNGVDLSSYEPDGDNHTPRITGVIDLRKGAPTAFGLSVVRKQSDFIEPVRSTWGTDRLEALPRGVGYGIQTYLGNGEPLPSFDRFPFTYSLGEGTQDTAERIWDHLNPDTRVALVVKSIGHIADGHVVADNISGTHYTIL